MPYLKIGNTDILPYVEAEKLHWTENDIDSPQAGRTLDGMMHRGKVTSKVKIEVEFLPLKISEARIFINAVSSEYITVSTDIDPKYGTHSYQMYNSTRPIVCYVAKKNDDGQQVEGSWTGLKLSLIER